MSQETFPHGAAARGRGASELSRSLPRPRSRTTYDELLDHGILARRREVVPALVETTGVVTLLAAAGYGKTMLLHEWDAADPRPFHWITEVGTRSAGEVAGQVVAVLTPARGEADPTPALGDALAGVAEPIVLVLDDIAASIDPDVRALVEELALAAPPALTVVLSGRSVDLPLLVSLRAARRVRELTPDDLAVPLPDVAEVVAPLPASVDLIALHDLAEGWPLGLRMLAQSIRDGVDPTGVAGADRLVADYVRAEVLPALAPELQEFMLACSPFPHLDPGFCSAVLDAPSAQDMLETLARDGGFVIPLDRSGRRYRWHRLVQQALLNELERQRPAELTRLRERAAAWFGEHDRAQEAVEQLLLIGDRASSVELLEDILLPMFRSGQLFTLVGWVRDMGRDVADVDGFVATALAYAGMMTGDAVCAQRWARVAATHFPSRTGDEPGLASYLVMRAWMCPDGVVEMLADTTAATDKVPETSAWRVPALLMHGCALLLNGERAEADAVLEETVHVALETGAPPAAVIALAERSLIASAAGDTARARSMAHRALVVMDDAGLGGYPGVAFALAVAAALDARAEDRKRSRANYVRADLLRARVGRAMPWLAVQTRIEMARTAALLGERAAADILIKEAGPLLDSIPDASTLQHDLDAVRQGLAGLPMASPDAPLLSAAELRVLPLLPSHLSFGEIGARLHLSRNTIKSHSISIYRKLGVTSRAEAVDVCRQLGLLDSGPG